MPTIAEKRKIEQILETSIDSMVDITDDVKKKIRTQIALGIAGEKTASQLVPEIEALLPESKALATAEAAVRTEIGRSYSVAQQIRGQDFEREGITVNKVWHHSGAARPHVGHEEMDGQTVKMTESFVNPVTGEALAYPRDPAAPASEVVNCGCYMTVETPEFAGLF